MKEDNLSKQRSAQLKDGLTDPSAARSLSWVEEREADGDLLEGDVVVVQDDGTVAHTTTVGDGRPTGVCIDDIDDGETGQVVFGGPVDQINLVASGSAGDSVSTSATPGEGQTATANAFAYLTSTGTTPTAFLWGGRGGGISGGGGTGPGSTPGWFDVTNPAYGATGDGTTDDTSAINAAIADINSTGCGVLYFPCGDYKVTTALTTITVPVLILGDGSMSFDRAAFVSRITFTSGSAVLFTITSKLAKFQNLGLYCSSGGTPSAGSAVLTDSAYLEQKVDFENVHISGFYDCLDIKVGAQWVMHNVLVTAPVRYGVRIRNTVNQDAGDWSISDSNFYAETYNSTAAIRMESSGGGKITNTKINTGLTGHRFGNGIDVSASGTTSILLVSNTSIENYSGDGVHISGDWRYIHLVGLEFGQYGNGTGNAIDISSNADVLIDDVSFRADTGTPTAITLSSVTRCAIGQLTNNGFSTLISGTPDQDSTGGVGARVFITGTPTSGQIPTATGGTAATWQTPTAPPSFATPAIVLGTAAAAGAASTVIRSDSTIVAFDATVPVTQAFSDTAATGSAAVAARRDHKHGMPAASGTSAGDANIWRPVLDGSGNVLTDGAGQAVMGYGPA